MKSTVYKLMLNVEITKFNHNFSINLFSFYYKKKNERLSAMLMSFHYLLHVADCIADCGPCWTCWQYPMERLCGMLLPLVHSRTFPYSNLTNNVLLLESFNHLIFISSLSYKYLDRFSTPPKV